jgi:hypothetical protein
MEGTGGSENSQLLRGIEALNATSGWKQDIDVYTAKQSSIQRKTTKSRRSQA